jgi:hypothetical protein
LKKKHEFKFENIKEALKGMSEEMITKHKDTQANCWWCTSDRHYTLECYAKKTDSGEEIIKAIVSATKKPIRDDVDNSSPGIDKIDKIAAICELFARQEKRICEINSDEEEDF